jgi:hypothetical protein
MDGSQNGCIHPSQNSLHGFWSVDAPIVLIPPDAVAEKVANGQEAAGRLEEEGDVSFIQAGKARAGHVACGSADGEWLGKGGMDGGDFFRPRRVRSEVASVKLRSRKAKFSSSDKVRRYRTMTWGAFMNWSSLSFGFCPLEKPALRDRPCSLWYLRFVKSAFSEISDY